MYQIVDISGTQITPIGKPFLSSLDAIKAAVLRGLPDNTDKVQVREVDTEKWLWEMFRK